MGKSKSCPRCGGNMLLDRDMDYWYDQCLQCSYRVELQPLNRYKDPVAADNAESVEDTELQEAI